MNGSTCGRDRRTLKFAFLIHPISDGTSSLIDLQLGQQLRSAWGQDSLLFCAKYHEAIHAAQSRGPIQPSVRVVDELIGLGSVTGSSATGRLYEVPMSPSEFLREPHRALESMREAVAAATEWGAELVGLGGLTAIVGSHGRELESETDIGVTTGNSLTAFAALQTVYQVCDQLELCLADETVAIVGIPGSIATVTAKLLADKVDNLLLVARTNSGRARKLAAELNAKLLFDIPEGLQQSRIVVTATSSGGCIHQRDLRHGSVVIDVAVPTDVVGNEAERDDVLILSGGLTHVPETFSRESAFLWFNHGVIPSCLGETIVLALDARPQSFSVGRNLDPERVVEIGQRARRHQFDFSALRSFGLPLKETEMMNVRKVVHRSRFYARVHHNRHNAVGETPVPDRPPLNRATDFADAARSRFSRHMNPVLAELTESTDFTKVFVRGEGAYLYDKRGKKYLDFVSGFGAVNLGHNHPHVSAAIQSALTNQAPGFAQASINPFATALADRLASLAPTGLDMSFFTNSGTESVEAALKLARLATGRHRFIYCHHSYHGKTLGALSVTGNRSYQKPFEPLLSDCKPIPFGDIDALTTALRHDEFAAFIVEPIQAEGGFHVPCDNYLSEALLACRAAGTLLIADEVQTGIGRTGALFAVDHWAVRPDIMTLAKSLGGGLMPIGAMLCSRQTWLQAYGSVQNYMLHSSTFGGGSLACAAALATLDVLRDERLLVNTNARSAQLRSGLTDICSRRRSVREVRGKGLLLGLEFRPMSEAATAHWNQLKETRLSKFLIPNLNDMLKSMSTLYTMQTLIDEHQIYTQITRSNPLVLRIQPPLIVSEQQVDQFLSAMDQTIGEMEFRESSIRDVIAKTGVGRHEKAHCKQVQRNESHADATEGLTPVVREYSNRTPNSNEPRIGASPKLHRPNGGHSGNGRSKKGLLSDDPSNESLPEKGVPNTEQAENA